MQFHSIINPDNWVGLKSAILSPLAVDGALYMPHRLPVIPRAFFNNISEMTIQEISYVVAMMMVGDDMQPDELKAIIDDTFNFPIPLRMVRERIYALELFHGPTQSFKDVGARFLARMISHYAREDETIHVLAATSGDSGSAIAEGFRDVEGVNVHILFPHGLLTRRQQAKLLATTANVEVIEVRGTFDDCQSLVRQALVDCELKEKMTLTTANTINVMRLMPQMFYYFHAVGQLLAKERKCDAPVISIPCGNLGNLTAGVAAMKMGLPVRRFVAACNVNDQFVKYLKTGEEISTKPVKTITPALDVGHQSNLARIKALAGNDLNELNKIVTGESYGNDDIKKAIVDAYCIDNYLLDPHSATAYKALCDNLKEDETGLFLSTAHPSKYPQGVTESTGVKFAEELDERVEMKQPVRIMARYSALKSHLEKRIFA